MTAPVNLNTSLKTPLKNKPDFLAIVHEAWITPPDWVVILAEEANRTTQTAAAKRIGYSGGAVSSVLRGTYLGDMGAVEQKVRGALMGVTVDCPVLAEIGRDQCLDEQKSPLPRPLLCARGCSMPAKNARTTVKNRSKSC